MDDNVKLQEAIREFGKNLRSIADDLVILAKLLGGVEEEKEVDELDKKISKLVSDWYKLISDYRKERDCHFTISIDYCYDGKIKYYLEHNGYRYGEWSYEPSSLEEAKKILVDKLVEMINELGEK